MARIIIVIFFLSLSACLRKKQSGGSEQIEAGRTQPVAKICSVNFANGQSLQEIAQTAGQMKTDCHLTENEVVDRVKNIN